MERKEKEKTEEPSWDRRRILGIAAAGAAAVAAGAFLFLSSAGDSSKAEEDTTTAMPRKMMKASDSGGESIVRDRFEKDPKNYFKTRRQRGSKAAVEDFQ